MTSKRILALDVGFKRIGIAVSDGLNLTARPLTIIHRKNNLDTFSRILGIIEDFNIGKLVVGLPLLNGKPTKISGKILRFTEKLEKFLVSKNVSVEIDFQDESFSTREAAGLMIDLRKKKKELDDIAAAFILESFLKR